MPRAGLEPTIPATKRPQTYALDRAATGIGTSVIYGYQFLNWSQQKLCTTCDLSTCSSHSNTERRGRVVFGRSRVQFSARRLAILSEFFVGLFLSIQAYLGIVPSIRSRLISSKFFPIRHSLVRYSLIRRYIA
jgi:hypothetical protein